MRSTAPYGSWSSPLRAARIAAGAKRIATPRFWRGAPCWLESRPERGRPHGAAQLAGRRRARAHAARRQRAHARPRVRRRRARLRRAMRSSTRTSRSRASSASAARPCRRRSGARATPTSPARADGRCLLAVEEEHAPERRGAREPARRLRPRCAGAASSCCDGRDFVSSPRFAPDGRLVACLAWNHPSLPWLGTQLMLVPWGAGRAARRARAASRAGPASRSSSPSSRPTAGSSWSPTAPAGGTSTQLDDDGALRCRARARGRVRRARSGGSACRATTSCRPDEIAVRLRRGREPAARAARAVEQRASRSPFELPYSEFEGVRVDRASGRALFVAAGRAHGCRALLARARERALPRSSRTPSTRRSTPTSSRRPRRSASRPPADARRTRFVYRPRSARFEGPPGARPPLVVKSHGGPTGATSPSLRLAHQFWTSRGFALVDVNYGGSTGYGRAYRELLHESWGVVDVEDCAHAALFLAQRGARRPRAAPRHRRQRGRLHHAVPAHLPRRVRRRREPLRHRRPRGARARHAQVRGALHGLAGGAVARRRAPATARARRSTTRERLRAPGDLLPGARGSRRAAGAGRGDGRRRSPRAACRTRPCSSRRRATASAAPRTSGARSRRSSGSTARCSGFAVDAAPEPAARAAMSAGGRRGEALDGALRALLRDQPVPGHGLQPVSPSAGLSP